MDEFNKLYQFITLAEKNRKYPVNTAQGRRASLNLFKTVLHADELESLDLIEERMKEIYLSLISKHKDTYSIKSLNTYKGRFLKVIEDYKRYGAKPETLDRWEVKVRKQTKKDSIKDIKKDTIVSDTSFSLHRPVYKLKISLEDGSTFAIEVPERLTKKDAAIITKIIVSLVE